MSIFGINKGKVEYIQKAMKSKGLSPKDMRGKTLGSHMMSLDDQTKSAIIDHIKSFKTLG